MTASGARRLFRELSVFLPTIEQARADYRDCAKRFPWPMPDGYTLPPESQLLVGHEHVPDWFNPLVEVYCFWRGATAVAARAAHARGDAVKAFILLDTIADTYGSDLRTSVIEDPAEGYLSVAIAPAQRGDYSVLLQTDIVPFLSQQQNAQAARSAGDL